MSSGGGKGGGSVSAGPMLEYGQKALDLQRDIYGTTVRNQQPWYQAGSGAVSQLGNLLGIAGPSSYQFSDPEMQKKYERMSNNAARYAQYGGQQGIADAIKNKYDAQYNTTEAERGPNFGALTKGFDYETFAKDPSYEFRLGEGQKALERRLNAQGKTFTPEAAKALADYNQQMASQEYGNAFNRFNVEQGNLYNRLAGLAGLGQTSANTIAGAGANYANAGSDIYTGMGNAVTAAQLANQSTGSSMFNTALGVGGQLGAAYLTGGGSLGAGFLGGRGK